MKPQLTAVCDLAVHCNRCRADAEFRRNNLEQHYELPPGWPDCRHGPAMESPTATPTQAVPRNQWPLTIAAIARHATVADKGIGDTVKRLWDSGNIIRQLQAGGVILQHRGAVDSIKTMYKLILNQDCGCGDVQASMNAMYPLVVK